MSSTNLLRSGIVRFEERIPHNETSAQATTTNGTKRNISTEEDLALLRQVLSERPFVMKRGKTMAAWGDFVGQLVSDDSFSRDKLSGKNAHVRFDIMVAQ
ncbi:hypothetical protein ON010_g3214 [Phytophthora cinnamomi]|nr:hypothetical protein ON010_g3214 [Phytophthora cinnamomi]